VTTSPCWAKQQTVSHRGRKRVRSVIAVGFAVLIAVGILLILLPSSSPQPETSQRPSSKGASLPSTSLPTTKEQLNFTDASRPLESDGSIIDASRSLPTTVIRPATSGTFPLVIFVHGYNSSPSTFTRFTTSLASEGYVVAAPSFPLEDPSRNNGLNRSDLPNEASDVSFVISQILASDEATHISPRKIAVVGHSDGADVALEVGYVRGLSDSRVQAVVASAPDPVAVATISGGPTLLLIHGSADQIVNPSSAAQVMSVIHAQTWSLTFNGADHASAILGPSQWTASFDRAINDFLLATLKSTSSPELLGTLQQIPLATASYQAGP